RDSRVPASRSSLRCGNSAASMFATSSEGSRVGVVFSDIAVAWASRPRQSCKIQSRFSEATQHSLEIRRKLDPNRPSIRANRDNIQRRNPNLRQRPIEERLGAANLVEGGNLSAHGFAIWAQCAIGFHLSKRFVEHLFALALWTDEPLDDVAIQFDLARRPSEFVGFFKKLARGHRLDGRVQLDDLIQGIMAVTVRFALILGLIRIGAQALKHPATTANRVHAVQQLDRFLALNSGDDRADGGGGGG